MKGNRKRRPCSNDRLFLNSGNFKTGLVGGRLKGKRGKELQVPQDASARCTDVVMAVSFYLSRKKKDYDALFPRLSRKRRSWERGLHLRFPVPPAWRGKGDNGSMAGVLRCLLWPFSPACQAKGYFTAPVEGPGNLRRECSRWPFPVPVDEKAIIAPTEGP